MNIYHNYRYGAHPVSDNVVLPQHENDVLVFHGFKNPEFENRLKENYFKTVLSQDDFIVSFDEKTNRFWWTKNSFLTDKNIKPLVRFEIIKNDKVLYALDNQEIFKYWGFFIGDCKVSSGIYDVKIVETETGRIIYKNSISI
jgi:hypothetical protein